MKIDYIFEYHIKSDVFPFSTDICNYHKRKCKTAHFLINVVRVVQSNRTLTFSVIFWSFENCFAKSTSQSHMLEIMSGMRCQNLTFGSQNDLLGFPAKVLRDDCRESSTSILMHSHTCILSMNTTMQLKVWHSTSSNIESKNKKIFMPLSIRELMFCYEPICRTVSGERLQLQSVRIKAWPMDSRLVHFVCVS